MSKLELTQGGHQLCSCHPTTTPASRNPCSCVAFQKANPSEDWSGPGSVEKLPTAAEVLGCCLLKGSVSRSGWGKQRFQGAPQGVAEQGLRRTTWDTNQSRPPRERPVGTRL